MFFRMLFCVILTAFSLEMEAVEPSTSRQKQMLRDLDFLTNLFQISYAPAQWKSQHFGWNLEQESLKAIRLVSEQQQTTKEFQRVVKGFCQTTKDYHVVPQFYSTEWASLPFHVQSAEGRYFVSYIDTDEIDALEPFPLSVGDELLFFDGIAFAEAVDRFRQKEIGNSYKGTDKALAEFYLTNRLGSSGHDVPQGSLEITFRKAGFRKPQTCRLEWDYHSELIADQKVDVTKSLCFKQASKVTDDSFFKKQFMSPHSRFVEKFKAANQEPSDMLGARKSMIPPLGTILWESDNDSEFYAYLFFMEDLKVGAYVRIPSFYVDGDEAASEFGEIIELFEEVSDVLVIDQLNNGGGLILYLYALLAMLTDYELDVPKHRVMLTQHDVYFAAKRISSLESIKSDRAARKAIGETLEGVVVNYRLAKCLLRSHQFIVDQWNEGKLFTDFCYMYGIDKITPHPEVTYKKPILVLTNSLDFSAADFFPAIMQDNKRATIMGSRTAGAGGYIEKVSFPNLSGIEEIDLTASFSQRPDGTPIENYGVTPDILYEVSKEDLQNNYIDYKTNILKQLNLLISEE